MPLQSLIEAAGVPGAVAMIADRDGVRDSFVAGVRDPATAAPMTLDTVFQIASMTKAVVSVAAMQLVERGLLDLDAPIDTVLPSLAAPLVIDGFDAAGAPVLRAARRAITLRHLLTHTSGLGYDFISADRLKAHGPGGPPTAGTLASLMPPLLFDPGDRWEYGVGTDWVGLAVEAASGQRLDDYIAEHIAGPLGMTDTMFHLDAERQSRLAVLQARHGDVYTPFPIDIGGGRNAEFLSGGGGLKSTAPDYMRFVRMLLGNGTLDGVQVLMPASVAEMSRNQIGALRAGVMTTTMPAFSHPLDVFPDMATGWGLGFLINPDPGPDGRAAGSLAWAGLANSYYWIDPASGITGVVMMQFMPFADPGALAVYAAVERLAYRR